MTDTDRQMGLPFALTYEQQFEAWKNTPGGAIIMSWCYRKAARYARAWQRSKKKVGMRLIWELVRYHFRQVRQEARARGVTMRRVDGYAMNDHFFPYAMRHIKARRPDWADMFTPERTIGKRRSKRSIVVQGGTVLTHLEKSA